MKIIKPGCFEKAQGRSLGGTCSRCGCQVEIRSREPEVKIEADRNETLYSMICPMDFCSETIWLTGIE